MTVGDDQQWMLVFPKITSRNRSDSVLRPFFFGGGGATKKKNPLRLAWLDTTVANFRAVPFKTQLTSIVPGGAKVAVVC